MYIYFKIILWLLFFSFSALCNQIIIEHFTTISINKCVQVRWNTAHNIVPHMFVDFTEANFIWEHAFFMGTIFFHNPLIVDTRLMWKQSINCIILHSTDRLLLYISPSCKRNSFLFRFHSICYSTKHPFLQLYHISILTSKNDLETSILTKCHWSKYLPKGKCFIARRPYKQNAHD